MQKVYYVKWDVGSHTFFSGSITDTISKGIKDGMYTIQFFMGDSTQAWQRQKISNEDIEKAKSLMNRFPMNVFTHYPFCANLAGQSQKGCLAWSGNLAVDRKLSGIFPSLEYELDIVAKLCQKRSGVVIHPGSYPNREDGHHAVAMTLNRLNFPKNSFLLLENCAGEGNKLCRSFEEILTVMNLLEPEKRRHVKVCVDTAHIWGQGDYDLSEVKGVDKMFEDFQRLLGIENFYLLHLNDSKVPLGSKKDSHACLGEGLIWKKSFKSLVHLLNKCKQNQIPMVLETDESDMLTLAILEGND